MNATNARRRAFAAAALLALAALLPACGRADLSGPPNLRLGRDECIACGMLINEDRCSSALLLERDGHREHALFDDLGCMLDYEHDHAADIRVITRFAHDHDSRAWAPADAASFLMADPDKLPTPMGSGIVAFATREAAERARERAGGSILSFDQLVPARRAWMESRYGKPEGKP